jgi:hypothetical protein
MGTAGFVRVWRLHLFVTSDRIRDPANSMFAPGSRPAPDTFACAVDEGASVVPA